MNKKSIWSYYQPLLGGFFIYILLSVTPAHAQQIQGIPLLDSLLATENYTAADAALQSQIKILHAAGNTDSLAHYPYYVGRIAQLTNGTDHAVERVQSFISSIEADQAAAPALRKAHLELASFYASAGRLTEAYQTNEKALDFTHKMAGNINEERGVIENNLGVLARRMGNVVLSINHHRKALNYFEQDDETAKVNYFISYNNMGAMMWYSSKTDSALLYYDKALQTLAEMEPNPKNQYYRSANVLNNKAALYSISGRTTEALATMQDAVKKYKQFIDSRRISDADRSGARQALFRSIENLGGVYKELGDFSRTRELLLYSYTQKRKYMDAGSPELFKAQILLGEIELALKNYDQALTYLNAGIKHIEQLPDDYLFWYGDAHYGKALLFDEQNEPQKAAPYFKKAEMLFEKAFGGAYDAFYLEFLANAALFYAENGNQEKALDIANKALDYVMANEGKNTLLAFKHRLNLAAVYYASGNYREAWDRSRKSLAILNKQHFKRNNLLDSIQVEFKKPDAMLLQAKAEYQLNSSRDSVFLLDLVQRIDTALAIIDRRKLLLSSDEDVNIQIANNQELFGFAKKIALELYKKTGNYTYLGRTIGYHESSLYNRIRSRLDARKAVQFADIPDSAHNREKEIKEKINTTLQNNDVNGFVQAGEEWRDFLETLRSDHPRYFALRYGPFKQQVDWNVPENTTVIRYLFIDGDLYALLWDGSKKYFFELPYSSVDEHIARLHDRSYDATASGTLLSDLYTVLWQPLESKVNTNRVIIIPDGELFNLSFETLVREPVTSFAELTKKSLLARYAISYNYSLTLLGPATMKNYKHNFIAFAPGFDEGLKQKYKQAVRDSLFLDHSYLNLLPQPFTVDLIQKLSQSFRGRAFTGELSTEKQFTTSAAGHRIIHIGTHAEANNLRPELSGLFFAKDMNHEHPENDNTLYAYEIYNHNLSSNLTILAACGTGKPHHQPGEGMISLAHAFNYAGSKSLLTALWNIDEKASSEIVDLFYQHLADGIPKDIALQQAKLTYLSTANGRTAAPVYWAGLVMLGDASTISIERVIPFWVWLMSGMILLSVASYFWIKRQSFRLTT